MALPRKQDDERRERAPFDDTFLSLRDAMNRFFDESVWSPGFPSVRSARGLFPKVDISETDTEVKVRANVPDIDPDDLDVEAAEDSIALSGRVERKDEEKGEDFYRKEREYGEFRRVLPLPARVDADSVKAKAKNGVLEVTLKKKEGDARTRVHIERE